MILKAACSKYFTYEDFICCGETWQKTKVDNAPSDQRTLEAIKHISEAILDKVVDNFGSIELTYGFCSSQLGNQIKKRSNPRITPQLDQHAGYEVNNRGNRICKRDGFACDFIIPYLSMHQVACWLVDHCNFDRLYFYGDQRPIHVSVGPENTKQIVVFKTLPSGNLIPKVISKDRFKALYE